MAPARHVFRLDRMPMSFDIVMRMYEFRVRLHTATDWAERTPSATKLQAIG